MRALICITSSVCYVLSRVCCNGFYYATEEDACAKYTPASKPMALTLRAELREQGERAWRS